MAAPDRPVVPPSPTATSPGARRKDWVRPFRIGLAVSAVLHLVVLALYPALVGIPGVATLPPSTDPSPETAEGLRLLALRELPPGVQAPTAPVPPPESLPEEEEDPFEETPPVTPGREAPPAVQLPGGDPDPGDPEETAEVRRRSAAELLRPAAPDPELFGERDLPPLSDEERYRLQLAGRLELWQDSVRAEMERAARATDWTYTDEEGNRWGVSPGRIHLGQFSLPLPFGFSTPPGLRDELERRGWQSGEIQRGAVEGAIHETIQERIREIRARREAERADTLSRSRE